MKRRGEESEGTGRQRDEGDQELTKFLLDGSHSLVRKQLFSEKLRQRQQHVPPKTTSTIPDFFSSFSKQLTSTVSVSEESDFNNNSNHNTHDTNNNSNKRRDVSNDPEADLDVHESLQCIVDVKYEVYGQGKKMSLVDQAYPTLKIMNHVGEEHVGKMR